MKYKDGDPDNLGGPGDLLPADIPDHGVGSSDHFSNVIGF